MRQETAAAFDDFDIVFVYVNRMRQYGTRRQQAEGIEALGWRTAVLSAAIGIFARGFASNESALTSNGARRFLGAANFSSWQKPCKTAA